MDISEIRDGAYSHAWAVHCNEVSSFCSVWQFHLKKLTSLPLLWTADSCLENMIQQFRWQEYVSSNTIKLKQNGFPSMCLYYDEKFMNYILKLQSNINLTLTIQDSMGIFSKNFNHTDFIYDDAHIYRASLTYYFLCAYIFSVFFSSHCFFRRYSTLKYCTHDCELFNFVGKSDFVKNSMFISKVFPYNAV